MYYDCQHRSLSLIQLKQLLNFPMLVTFTKLKYFYIITTNQPSPAICMSSHLKGSVLHQFATMLVNISQRFALIACLYVIHFNLSKSRQTMAEDKNEVSQLGLILSFIYFTSCWCYFIYISDYSSRARMCSCNSSTRR